MKRMKKDKNYKVWKRLLNLEWNNFITYGNKGFSSKTNVEAQWFGKQLADFGGKILDVGCGVLPLPVYMRYTKEAEWYGIDPLGKGIKRKFHFKVGVAEHIPYDDSFFDVVVYATSLDHLCNINQAIVELKRVLKPKGYVVVWTGLITKRQYEKYTRYREWMKQKRSFDDKHLWGFTDDSLAEYFKDFERVSIKWNKTKNAAVLVYKNR
jgi:ubiquinone/menaquinone biosynthesis C-methylase UbiE